MKKLMKKISLIMICIIGINMLKLPGIYAITAYAQTNASSVEQQVENSNSVKNLTVPTNIKCESKSSNSITLAWDKVDDGSVIAGYDIYQGLKKIGTTNGETKYTVNGLTPSSKYKFYITAKDNEGNVSLKSNVFEEMTSEEQTPGNPSDNGGDISKPETLIYVENQDFSKVIEGEINVTGCFLSNDNTAVNAKVYIDGVDKTNELNNLVVGTERKDIQQKYPQYDNSLNSGFSFNLDTYTVLNGEHKLKLMIHETSKEFTIKVNNITGQIVLDSSDYNQSQQGIVQGSGYILSSYDPSKFSVFGGFDGNSDIYVDGKAQSAMFDKQLIVQIKRDDVKQKNPSYKYADKCGFSFTIDKAKLTNGEHKIKIKILNIEKEFTINVQNKYKDIIIEGINTNQVQEGAINGTGYILSSYDPSIFNNSFFPNCSVYVDGNDISSSITTQIKRDDVKLKYPDYKYADKCGFSFTINTLKLSDGKHIIKIKLLGIEKEIAINVKNKKSDIIVDGITTNKTQEGIISGTGYILSGYDVSLFSSGCDIYVDGNYASSLITTQVKRDDVKLKYPSYKYSDNCGFSYTIDTVKLSNGLHTVKLQLLNSEKEFTINVQNMKSDIVIDGINNNQPLEGIITGTGYILSSYDPSGFKSKWWGECEVYVDNVGQNPFMGDLALQVQMPRSDVKQKYPNYKYADNCGFSFTIDTAKFSNGEHKLKIKLNSLEKEIIINVNNKPSDIVVESASKSAEGKFVISGYTLSPYSPEQIKNSESMFADSNEVYIDGNSVSSFGIVGEPGYNVTLGIRRDDIKAKYPNYKYAGVSGFVININSSTLANLAAGSHKIQIVFRSVSKEFTFNISK